MSPSAQAAITKYCRLGGHLFLPVLEAVKSKIKDLIDSVRGESLLLLGLYMGCLLAMPCLAFPWDVLLERESPCFGIHIRDCIYQPRIAFFFFFFFGSQRSIPLCKDTVFHIYLLRSTWVVFYLWLLPISLPQTFVHEPLCECTLSFLLEMVGLH